eukprot:6709268-Pyramimonas_sp.AAC.1
MSKTCLFEQEWDFPKGRRKLGEKDFACALREFQEESNVGTDEVVFYVPYKHFEEICVDSVDTDKVPEFSIDASQNS